MVWLDDVLLAYAHSIEELLALLFGKCHKFGLKLKAKKCTLFSEKVRWCGRIISKDGIAQDPERVLALTNLNHPTTGGELQQFVCALNWMRMSIPLGDWLAQLLEKVDSQGGCRKKRRIANLSRNSVGTRSMLIVSNDAKRRYIVWSLWPILAWIGK